LARCSLLLGKLGFILFPPVLLAFTLRHLVAAALPLVLGVCPRSCLSPLPELSLLAALAVLAIRSPPEAAAANLIGGDLSIGLSMVVIDDPVLLSTKLPHCLLQLLQSEAHHSRGQTPQLPQRLLLLLQLALDGGERLS